MNDRDYRKLKLLTAHFYRGGLPDLAKPHPKAGYRWTVGFADYGHGKVERWRENLGHDLLTAQYRAREMTDVWSCHVDDHLTTAAALAGGAVDIETVGIPPLDREAARREAWEEAAAAMAEPSKMARQATATLRGTAEGQLGPALSPGFRLVAVPVGSPDPEAGEARDSLGSPPKPPDDQSVLTLHDAADRWLTHLKGRLDRGDVSDSYVQRIGTEHDPRLKELAGDSELRRIGKPELDEIRIAMQGKKTKQGEARSRGTITTELGHLRTLFTWLKSLNYGPPPRANGKSDSGLSSARTSTTTTPTASGSTTPTASPNWRVCTPPPGTRPACGCAAR